MQASSSIWKILKARFESDLLVKSQGEETGLIKKSEKVPEKVFFLKNSSTSLSF